MNPECGENKTPVFKSVREQGGVLRLAQNNILKNVSESTDLPELVVAQMRWGHVADIRQVLEFNAGHRYDAVFGADVAYDVEVGSSAG
eukprot:5938260-Amphidinium_carterae.1